VKWCRWVQRVRGWLVNCGAADIWGAVLLGLASGGVVMGPRGPSASATLRAE
jgi:hypothetical protein